MTSIVHNRDLVIGVFMLLAATIAFYWLGGRLVEHSSTVVANLLATVATLATFLFALLFWGRLELAAAFPITNVILIANWLPLGAALLMGNVMAQSSLPSWRRLAIAAILGVLAWYTVVRDLSGWSAICRDTVYNDGLPVQTADSSCSACSAALLLRHYGIQATEREMTALCLTRRDGTPELGLYRGLKIKSRGTPWDVRVVHLRAQDVARSDFAPMLALIRSGQAVGAPEPSMQWFSSPSHAVVFYGFSDGGELVMADPVAGFARRYSHEFAPNWPVKGIQLVRREKSRSE